MYNLLNGSVNCSETVKLRRRVCKTGFDPYTLRCTRNQVLCSTCEAAVNGHLQAIPIPWQKPRKQGKDSLSTTSPVEQEPLERAFGRVAKRGGSSRSSLRSILKSFRVQDQ